MQEKCFAGNSRVKKIELKSNQSQRRRAAALAVLHSIN